MKIYAVKIRQLYEQTVYIEAETASEAKRKARQDPWQFEWVPDPDPVSSSWVTKDPAKDVTDEFRP